MKKSSKAEPVVKDVLSEVIEHYTEAKGELSTRINHKERGFDTYDRVYRNFIDKNRWPFAARVPDGRGATLLKRKDDRIIANKMQGKMIPTKSGTELGAMVASELILHQWSQVDLKTDEPMLMRWRKTSQSARKYGAGFGFAGWRTTKDFDGPIFEHLENRNVLLQPGARSIDESEWVQVRRYVTLNELKTVNDVAKSGPIYSPDKIAQLNQKDSKSTEYQSINKEVIGLSNSDQGTSRIELVTEYRRDRWITFVPKQGKEKGVVLRDIPNPYKHGEIPILRLVYDLIDDDIYGVPELEAVLPLVKANWALLSQYLEQAQNELFTPLMVNPTQVQLDTLTFESGARWLMNKPGADVVKFDMGTQAMSQFQGVFGLVTSLIMEGMGETGEDVSVLQQQVGDKTATEVRDMAMLRTARDNANKLALSQAIGKMVYLWYKMSQQFITGQKLVRIAGKDALNYLINEGLHNWKLNDSGLAMVSAYAEENNLDFDTAYEELRGQGALEAHASPIAPVQIAGDQVPKLSLEKGGKSGFLTVTKEDLAGDYDYIVDIEAMSIPNDQSEVSARTMVSDMMLKTEGQIGAEGFKIKWKEFISDLGEKAKLKNMEQYFESNNDQQVGGPQMPQQMPGQPPMAQPNGIIGQPSGVDPSTAGGAPQATPVPQGAGPQSQGLPQ